MYTFRLNKYTITPHNDTSEAYSNVKVRVVVSICVPFDLMSI